MSCRVLSGALVLFFLTGALAGQQTRQPAAPPDLQTPTFKIDVEYVEVDVRVTDRQGSFVRDLKQEDFEVHEDGKPQTISAFSLVDIPVEPSAPPVVLPSPIEPDVQSNERRFDGRLYVVMLDDLHTDFRRTIAAKTAVRRFIEQHFGANDLMAIVFTGQSEAAQELTGNKRLLLAAVDRFMGRKVPTELENRNTPQPLGPGGGPSRPDLFEHDREERLDHGRRTMAALSNVADWFTGVRGRRKAIILVSEGFSYPLIDVLRESRSGGRGTPPGRIGRTDVSIYPVDPRRLATGAEDTIEWNNFAGNPTAEARAVQEDLRVLADETGGFAVLDTNDTGGAFERMVADNSTYYVLAYYPPHPRDDRFHRIDVRVKRPGVTVRSRRGYTMPAGDSPATRVANAGQTPATLLNALNSPIQLSDLRMRVFAAPFRTAAPNASVLLGIEMVGRDLPLESDGRIEISYVAFDAKGARHGLRNDTLRLNLEPATRARVEQTGVRVLNRMDLAPGRYQLRVAAHDVARTVAGSIIYDLEVPDFDREPLSMSGVLLMSKSGAAVMTARVDEQTKGVLPAAPIAVRTFPQNDELAVFAEVYENDAAPGHTIEIVTTVRSDAGVVAFEEMEELESNEPQRAQGVYRHTRQIPLASLEPGAYVLSVEARSQLKKDLATSRHVRFTITPPVEPAR